MDTAKQIRLAARAPSEKRFVPIGHIALDLHPPEEDEKLGLPRSGVAWIHQLYISFALQGKGFGVAAMAKAEQLATLEPFNASTIVLDTVAKELHLYDAVQRYRYDDRGLLRPFVSSPSYVLEFRAVADISLSGIERRMVHQVGLSHLRAGGGGISGGGSVSSGIFRGQDIARYHFLEESLALDAPDRVILTCILSLSVRRVR